jgi:hypothetical protein
MMWRAMSFGTYLSDELNMAGKAALSWPTAPSSIHFMSGVVEPGRSTNRTGCAELISVRKVPVSSTQFCGGGNGD